MPSSLSSHQVGEPSILHGGDYNPEQWLHYPNVLNEDFRRFALARINSITIGVFAWAALEPEEGCYCFDWMDDIIERAARRNMRVVLATPSGGKPNWLAQRYPEVRRVSPEGGRDPQHGRHNHCLTSPIYREKVGAINLRLAERYGHHPSLTLWHISNEFSGYCYCDLCRSAFRQWLQLKYENLDALNDAYWSRFWSHTYTSWDQIHHLDKSVDGLVLDWKRFMTDQCCSFIRQEAEPLRRFAPGVPVTTNLMLWANCYNYWELAKELDVISWDSYPNWHSDCDGEFDESRVGMETAFHHDMFRSMKGGKPFLLMETTPSQVNWKQVSPLRRPGVNRLNGLQAVAHGSDAVCYFQLRRSRGSSEQFHGAVIDHSGNENNRVFREVAALGECLEKLKDVVGARIPARVAIIFDKESKWALEQCSSAQTENKNYTETLLSYYLPLWKRGIAVDVIDSQASLEPYTLVIAPMLFLLDASRAENLTGFVKRGGTLVATYHTGLVDEATRCFMNGAPGPLRQVLGLWVEEFDALPDLARRQVCPLVNGEHGLSGTYEARHYLDLVHLEGAEALAVYGEDFYADRPALARNRVGKGRAYYVASRNDERFTDDFLGFLLQDLGVRAALSADLPKGVSAHCRTLGHQDYCFLLNFTPRPVDITLQDESLEDMETGDCFNTIITLQAFGSRIFRRASLQTSGKL